MSLINCIILRNKTYVSSVDCEWNEINEWSVCSQTCGGGGKSRTRSIKIQQSNGGNACNGEKTETQPCNTNPCPGQCGLLLLLLLLKSLLLLLIT